MNTSLTSGIVRILRPDGKIASTGFVVAGGLIATCAHVVPREAQPRGDSAGEKVDLVFRATGSKGSAQVVAEWWRSDDAEDVAILRLEVPLPEGVRPCPWALPQELAIIPFRPSAFLQSALRKASGETDTSSMRP